MATSDSNTTESFCGPRSWTNNLSRRHKRHGKYGKCGIYLFMVYLLFRGLKDSSENNMKNREKTYFSLLQALCVLTAAFLQYFLMAAFCWMLVEGIYFFLFVVKVYNIDTKMHMYHLISWGIFISLVVNYCKLLNRNRLKIGRMTSRVALTPFYLCLGLPIIMVSISVSIAVGKDGIKSYTSEK